MAPGRSEPPSDALAVEHPRHPAEALEHAFVVREPPRHGHAATVEITASAETTAQTGVEMEALVAASVAALTVYDMAKAIDKGMVVEEVRLLEKTKEPL